MYTSVATWEKSTKKFIKIFVIMLVISKITINFAVCL